MATINAAISVTSDVTGYGTTINNSMTMTKAGTIAGLDQATGLVRKTLTSTNEVDLLVVGLGKPSGTATKQAFAVTDDANRSVEIGRLYSGDWMIIPWVAASDEHDVFVKPSVSTSMVIEYMVFFE